MDNMADLRTLVSFLPDLANKAIVQFGENQSISDMFAELKPARLATGQLESDDASKFVHSSLSLSVTVR